MSVCSLDLKTFKKFQLYKDNIKNYIKIKRSLIKILPKDQKQQSFYKVYNQATLSENIHKN